MKRDRVRISFTPQHHSGSHQVHISLLPTLPSVPSLGWLPAAATYLMMYQHNNQCNSVPHLVQ